MPDYGPLRLKIKRGFEACVLLDESGNEVALIQSAKGAAKLRITTQLKVERVSDEEAEANSDD